MNAKIIYTEAEKKIVFIGLEKIINNQKAVNVIGSGFLVKDSIGVKLISAAHVFLQAQTIAKVDAAKVFIGVYREKINNITQYDIKYLEIDKVICNQSNDIGVLLVSDISDINTYQSSRLKLKDNYEAGANCISVGFPLANEFMNMGVGLTLFLSGSVIASVKYNSIKKKIDFLLTDSHVNPSSSGSPFFDVDTGEIIGVVSGTFQNNFVNPVMSENKIPQGIQVPRNIGLIRPACHLSDYIK